MTNLEKWAPILDTILENKKTSKKLKNFLAEYAEYHSRMLPPNIEMKKNEVDFTNTLPISLKILSNLDIEDKFYYIIDTDKVYYKIDVEKDGLVLKIKNGTDIYDTYTTDIEISDDIFKDDDNDNIINIIKNTEDLLIDENIKILNKMLKDKKEFGVRLLVNSLAIIKKDNKHYLNINNLIKIK
jgi:hypothetical protein